MKRVKQISASILRVTVEDPITEREFSYDVWEFENGLVLVPSETTNSWFFGSIGEFQPCGLDIVLSVIDTGEVREMTSKDLLESIQGSIREFGVDSVPEKHTELWK